MRSRIIRLLAVTVAVLCVLAACATAAGWILLDASAEISFLDRAVSVELLLTCGAILLALCIGVFVIYVARRRAARA